MVTNLKTLRKQHNISQQQLANAIGVSQQSINKYENHNIEPDITTLIMMADFFHTSVDYLIGHTNENRPVEPMQAYELNNAEAELINKYRKLDAEKRKLVETLLEHL